MSSPVIALQLTQSENGSIDVRVIKSPKGEPKGTFALPFSQPFQSQAVNLALEKIKFERSHWEAVPDLFKALKDLQLGDEQGFKADLLERIGSVLFKALFSSDELREALHAAVDAGDGDNPARIELRFDDTATDLGAYPWELLHDDGRAFLFRKRTAALIRYITCNLSTPQLLHTNVLNLLFIAARPIDADLGLLLDVESTKLEESLAEPIQKGRVRLAALPRASPKQSTWDALTEYLNVHKGEDAPHVIHFDGHGGFGKRCPPLPEGCGRLNPANVSTCKTCKHPLTGIACGYLAFEKANKSPQWISSEELGDQLAGIGVRLAVLTACKSAAVTGESMFTGIAPALIRVGVPAVVAMQYSVTTDVAMRFSKLFYLSLGQPKPLTSAVGDARAGLFDKPTAWYRPVLYLRDDGNNPEGQLFAPAKGGDPPPPKQPYEPAMLLIPAGSFLMGSQAGPGIDASETPRHEVTLPAYYIGKYPITNREYAEFVSREKGRDAPETGWFGRTPLRDKWDHPVADVSWQDAVAYCLWLSQQTDRTYRLPTEAEWEKAARGTDGRVYPWGDTWADKICNAGQRDNGHIMPVNAFPGGASPYGCQDMLGNTQEWTTTLWGTGTEIYTYRYQLDDGREDLDNNHLFQPTRVHRGGSYRDDSSRLRCAARNKSYPASTAHWRGFRVVVEP
jgi:formylglycine-generating enzyme required for sulfatase activity